jgi:hypothetical protein
LSDRSMRDERLSDAEIERWLTLFWMNQAGQDTSLTEQWSLGRPATEEDVAAGVARLCARHEMLRSRYDIDPDGQPVRRVVPMADFVPPISFVDAGAPRSAPEIGAADSTDRFLWHLVFPVEEDGLVHRVDLHLQHIVADATGVAVWRAHMDQAIQDPDWVCGVRPKGRSGPSDVDSSADERRDGRLARASQAVVPAVRSRADHSHFEVTTVLPGLVSELHRVGDAAGVSIAVAAKFLVAWAMAQLSGRPDVLLANVVYPGSFKGEEIDCKFANLRELVTVGEENTFRAALNDVQAESFSTYLAWESRDYSREIDRDARMLWKRGIGGIAPIYFDYITAGQQAASHSAGETLWEQSVTEVGTTAVECLSPLFVFRQLNDRDLQLAILADEKIIDVNLAMDLPRILTKAALQAQQVSSPVSAAKELFPDKFRFRSDAELAGGRWVCLADLGDLLAECPGVVHAEVKIADERVLAELVLDASGDVFDVHEFVTCRLSSKRTICAPDTYFWQQAGGSARQEWAATRDALPVLTCRTRNEELLVAAFQECHGEGVPNLAETYVQAGGRLVLAPAVLRRLEEHGLTGLGREHFEAPFSLRGLARLLHP